jgi:hypothetical protein
MTSKLSEERKRRAELFLQALEKSEPPFKQDPTADELIRKFEREFILPSAKKKCCSARQPRGPPQEGPAPLKVCTVVRDMGYAGVDSGKMLEVAARLREMYVRVRGKQPRKDTKSVRFWLGLGAECVYTEDDRALAEAAAREVLGEIG